MTLPSDPRDQTTQSLDQRTPRLDDLQPATGTGFRQLHIKGGALLRDRCGTGLLRSHHNSYKSHGDTQQLMQRCSRSR